MNVPNISARLLAVAELTREGSFVADVGTDHAYLPIYLCAKGKIRGAVASDINRGPLDRAEINVKEYALEDKIALCLTNGLDGIDIYAPDDILICGMGGELIAEIINKAEWTKNKNIRLILQPMTKQEHLRRYLLTTGFEIIAESYSFAEGKYYVTVVAEYTGASRDPEIFECELGRECARAGDRVAYIGYLEGKARSLHKSLAGKMQAGLPTDAERELLAAIEKRIASVQ